MCLRTNSSSKMKWCPGLSWLTATSLGTIEGTSTNACGWGAFTLFDSLKITIKFKRRLLRNGNGCPASTARGVSTGKTCTSKYLSSRLVSFSSSSSIWCMKMLASLRDGIISFVIPLYCSLTKVLTLSAISSSCWRIVLPLESCSLIPAAKARKRLPTRTIKNSSRLELKIDVNFSFSIMGVSWSWASSSTR